METKVVKRFNIWKMKYEYILQGYVNSSNIDYDPFWQDIKVLTKLEVALR